MENPSQSYGASPTQASATRLNTGQ